jgi:amidohydrolase
LEPLLRSVAADVVEWRRHLHCHPELSFQEYETAQFVHEKLQSFGGLEISRPTKTSVVARLVGNAPGKVLAMRADMDALPLQEENTLEYMSQNPGVMHACGHDGHTAMLLGAAKVLTQLQDQLKGEVRFIFQHAEEQPPGGAQELVAAGAVKGIDEIIGLHVSSDLPVGKIGLNSQAILANTDTFDIVINGKGGHGSRPETTIDPISIGAQIVANLQHIISRNISALEPVVLSITTFHGGTSHNIIPQSVTLGGTVRSFDAKIREKIPLLMEQIIKGITDAHGATFKLDYHQGYGALVNDPGLVEKLKEIAGDLVGSENVIQFPRRMAGEDFSAYLKEAPGCFIFIGTANVQKNLTYSSHNPRFDIDEQALEYGLKLNVYAALGLTDSAGA